MKLTRFHLSQRIHPGIFLDESTVIDAGHFGEDWNEAFFGSNGLGRLRTWLDANISSAPHIPVKELYFAPAIARPSKIICIGLNYADHARESGMQPPAEPVVFFKATTAWSGPNDNLVIPKGSKKTDWEVELAVVIGKTARGVSQTAALSYVAGYAIHNDYSERAWQLEGTGQWVKGKSADTFAPFGPFLATPDELDDIGQLRLWLKVNDDFKQDGSTSDLLFNIPHLVSYLSQFMTLLPGDVISTGTPAGVGHGRNPPEYIRPGDRIELGIEGLGVQKQLAVSFEG